MTNTSVKRPFSIIDIERNKKDFYQRQLEQNKTFLNPQKDVNPNAKQVFIDEQQKREANNRINKRQDLVNNVALAASPLGGVLKSDDRSNFKRFFDEKKTKKWKKSMKFSM